VATPVTAPPGFRESDVQHPFDADSKHLEIMNTNLTKFALFLPLVGYSSIAAQPSITQQPKDQAVSLFADATFRSSVTGDSPLSYQWRFNSVAVAGMTTTSLTITNVQRTNAGNYDLVVTNLSGSVTSQVATLSIVPFSSIYCFGDSWTDTHNCTWDPIRYWNNRASNGPRWPEQLSTNLGLVYSAAGNYAHCGASLDDELNQIDAQLQVPPKPALSLYCIWGGADLRGVTNEATLAQAVRTFVPMNLKLVKHLYARGARSIMFENQQDWSKFPGVIKDYGTNTALLSVLSEYTRRWNDALLEALISYSAATPDVRVYWVDVFGKLNDVIKEPETYGFTKVNVAALDDLTDISFTGPGASYVFWDDYHLTTKADHLLAQWHEEALHNPTLEALQLTIAGGSPVIQMNHLQIGRDYAVQTSPELLNWDDLYAFTAAAGTNLWSGGAGQTPVAYFRLKWRK
jgi:phospholipase/lecithinase/hemolysin